MNRFEALHALGLEENASEEDVRLAYYGLEKAVGAFDFSDSERIDQRVKGMVEHAKESRNFLLSVRNQTVARKVRSFAAKQRGKLSVTPVEEKTARLHGLEQLRGVIVSYHSEERSKRRGSIIALLACIVVGFIGIRYLRGGPRVVAFSIIGAIAVAGSTILTASHLQVRKARAHVLELDDAIAGLRRELGLEPPEEDGYDAAEAQRRAKAAARGLTAGGAGGGPNDPGDLGDSGAPGNPNDSDAPEPGALEPDSYEVDDPDDFDGDRTARKGARA